MVKGPKRLSLGQYLEQAREEAGISLRQLVAATGIPQTTINRLLKDEVEKPNPEHLARLADALELNPSDLFMVAGLPIPQGMPSIDALLRAEYDLPEEAVAEARRNIQAIVEKYDGRRPKSQH
jgi:transcriptional regulator with XRE-family HTH domain